MANLADIITGDTYNLKMLSKAIREAGLVDTLRESGPFTVFAPVDEAFSKLPLNTVDEIFDNKTRLKAILTYHVVPEKLSINDLRNLQTENLTTMQGQSVTVDPHRWHLHLNPKINGISITDRKDVVADNGVLHEIDSMLMPNLELTCPGCGRGFLNKADLDAHVSAMHREKAAVIPSPAAVAAPVAAVGTVAASAVAAKAAVKAPRKAIAPVAARTRRPAFEVHMDKSNEYRFHLKAPNGEIIGESQSFPTAELCDKDIALVRTNAPIAKTMQATENVRGPVFEQFTDVAGKWRFNLREPDGSIILASQAYKSIDSCNNGIASVRKNAPLAKTVYTYQQAKTSRGRKSEEKMMTH